MNLIKMLQKDLEELHKKYPKEIESYEKIGNDENFRKIIQKINSLGKYEVELDSLYAEKTQCFGITKIKYQNFDFYFGFYDFCGWDACPNMEDHLKGGLYNFDVKFPEEFNVFNVVETGYKAMLELKEIFDKTIKEG